MLNESVALSGVKATANNEAEKPVSLALFAQELSESDWMTLTAEAKGVARRRNAIRCQNGIRHWNERILMYEEEVDGSCP